MSIFGEVDDGRDRIARPDAAPMRHGEVRHPAGEGSDDPRLLQFVTRFRELRPPGRGD